MVVHDSVILLVTRIGDQVDLSKALNHPGSTHLMLPNSKAARRMSRVCHNWSLLKSDRFSSSKRTYLTYLSLVGALSG